MCLQICRFGERFVINSPSSCWCKFAYRITLFAYLLVCSIATSYRNSFERVNEPPNSSLCIAIHVLSMVLCVLFNNQLCGSNMNYVRHYDVLRHNYVDCMYTIFVVYPTAMLRVGDTKLHNYPSIFLFLVHHGRKIAPVLYIYQSTGTENNTEPFRQWPFRRFPFNTAFTDSQTFLLFWLCDLTRVVLTHRFKFYFYNYKRLTLFPP